MKYFPLTPTLSHPMGGGEPFDGSYAVVHRRSNCACPQFKETVHRCSLAHRMGEGQGEDSAMKTI